MIEDCKDCISNRFSLLLHCIGMGLAYQNGMTFYNTAAPAPATSIAPPTDPGTIYQATGVFGKHYSNVIYIYIHVHTVTVTFTTERKRLYEYFYQYI